MRTRWRWLLDVDGAEHLRGVAELFNLDGAHIDSSPSRARPLCQPGLDWPDFARPCKTHNPLVAGSSPARPPLKGLIGFLFCGAGVGSVLVSRPAEDT